MLRNPADINAEVNRRTDTEGDGSPNAFKHCLASCIQTAENGYPFAVLGADIVEIGQIISGHDTIGESLKDQFNNEIGRQIGQRCFSDILRTDEETSRKIVNQCANSCKAALNGGVLQTETFGPGGLLY